MVVSVVEPPGEIVSLIDAKKHLRVDHSDDDSYITGLVAAASTWVDAPGWIGRAFGVQVLELATDRFGDCCRAWIDLPFPPVIEILSVRYIDPDGVETTMSPDDYELAFGKIRPKYGVSWPAVRCQSDAVRIEYRAGYGTPDASDPPVYANAIPAPVKVAILMLVGQWYQTREPVTLGQTVEHLPFAVEALLSPYRVFR
jgi:uncharacterized phiE125 gp8 family phage protein